MTNNLIKLAAAFFLFFAVFSGAVFVLERQQFSQMVSQEERMTQSEISTKEEERPLRPPTENPASFLPEASPEEFSGAVPSKTDPQPQQSIVPGEALKSDVQEVSAPGPLMKPSEGKTEVQPDSSSVFTVLDAQKIFALTNNERAKEGLPALSFQLQLGAMAQGKAVDMINKQYFEHESPEGTGIGGLAQIYGYAFLNVGENLALGDFDSNEELVKGWMDSPGHRANILSGSFTEIGVAVLRGNYNGRQVWFAVQEFGRPQSDCPLPEPFLKVKIEIYQEQIAKLEVTLISLKAEIDAPDIDRDTYEAKVKDYNTIVKLYDEIAATAEADIALYNGQVSRYNLCAEG